MNANYPYQTREVRDLAWACFAPTLLTASHLPANGLAIEDCGLTLTTARRRWLAALDRNPTPLLEHLSRQRGHRLGLYFEHLWHFFLTTDPATELVAHNLPVRAEGRTLGEFDCIYYCLERGRHVHLELAVKFFLGYDPQHSPTNPSQWQCWLGPNSQDRLDLKLGHLLNHQIRLGEDPLAAEELNRLGVSSLSHEIIVKGYLFRNFKSDLPPPHGFNTQARLESWVHIDQLHTFLTLAADNSFLVLPKARWLAPALVDPDTPTLTSEELQEHLHSHFHQQSRPQLIATLDQQGMETRRFFVTGPDWPASSPQPGDHPSQLLRSNHGQQ